MTARLVARPGVRRRGPKAQVLVAYHSLTGNTKAMAEGVAEGVQRVPGVAVTLKPVDAVTKADLEGADGIILGWHSRQPC